MALKTLVAIVAAFVALKAATSEPLHAHTTSTPPTPLDEAEQGGCSQAKGINRTAPTLMEVRKLRVKRPP